MIDKLIFLSHQTARTNPGSITSGNPWTGLIVVIGFVVLGIVAWIYFTRKKSIVG